MTDAHRVDVTSKCCLYLKKLTYSPKKVCYQTSALPSPNCLIGDRYELSEDWVQIPGQTYRFTGQYKLPYETFWRNWSCGSPGVVLFTAPLSWQFIFNNRANTGSQYDNYSLFVISANRPNGYTCSNLFSHLRGQLPIWTTNLIRHSTGQPAPKTYKIKIFDVNNTLVHEYSSGNPITAWIEPEQCEESEEWNLKKCWEQLPDDFVFIDIGGNSRTFYKISRQNLWIHCPDTAPNNPDFPNSIDVFNCLAENPPFAFREDSVIYVDKKPPDCPFPAYKIECDPCSNDNCEDPPCEVIDCPEGYYFDDLDCICKVVPDPCPPGFRWVKQPYSDGYCIPEDECEFKECPPDYYWSVEECDCLPYDPCPEGWYRNELGYCVPRQGCTDPSAYNYDPEAVQDDGSCVYKGCTDPNALNYNPRATIPDFCLYPPPPPKKGCTDPEAYNYDPLAQVDDGSCVYKGCMDENALNYDPQATIPDGSCIYPPDPPRLGCTDPFALNYDPLAEIDDGTCIYPDPDPRKKGCTNPFALNFDPEAEIDDGSCRFPPPIRPPDPPCETRECPDGYYFDSVDCICRPIPIYPPPPDDNNPPSVEYPPPPSECQECPPETTCSFICNGIVCCYDKNFCLIAYFPESLLC